MKHSRSFAQRLWAGATLLVASALCSNASFADLPQLALVTSKPIFEAGEPAVVTLFATPGDLPFLLINAAPGATNFPGLGTIFVALDTNLTIVRGALVPVGGSLDFSCNFQCDSPVIDAPCFLQAVTLDGTTLAFTGMSNLAVLKVTAGDCGDCASAAPVDGSVAQYGGGHAFYLPGLANDFAFVGGGRFTERADGSARLSGVIESASDASKRFAVDVLFDQRLDFNDSNYAPAGSPKLELQNSAYSYNGGPVNPDTWHYYELTFGTLTGQGLYDGGMLQVTRMGPAFQVGFGANGKNANLGASGWLTLNVLANPTNGSFPALSNGDINIDFGEDCPQCAVRAVPDSKYSTSSYTHSFYLPEIGKDFCFDPAGQFVEYENGTARLTGTIRRTSHPLMAWTVDVDFQGRVNPGAALFPPVGSPKLSLKSGAYKPAGPVDPSGWHYYASFDGLLTGVDDYQGAQLHIWRDGPAFQVGVGANDKNLVYGASGWLNIQILSHPSMGALLPSGLDKGDINIELECP